MATIKPNNSKVLKTKIVNINARIPIKTTTPPIYGVRTNVEMTISDILKCLTRRAIIDQVLSDGTTVRLNTKNFCEDFEAQLRAKLKVETKKLVEDIKLDGKIDDLNLVDDIDDDDDDNSDEPEEAGVAVVIDDDGNETIGKEPEFPEVDDHDEVEEEIAEANSETVNEEAPVEDDTSAEEVKSESEEIKIEESVSEEVVKTDYKKSNSNKKSGSKKKK